MSRSLFSCLWELINYDKKKTFSWDAFYGNWSWSWISSAPGPSMDQLTFILKVKGRVAFPVLRDLDAMQPGSVSTVLHCSITDVVVIKFLLFHKSSKFNVTIFLLRKKQKIEWNLPASYINVVEAKELFHKVKSNGLGCDLILKSYADLCLTSSFTLTTLAIKVH